MGGGMGGGMNPGAMNQMAMQQQAMMQQQMMMGGMNQMPMMMVAVPPEMQAQVEQVNQLMQTDPQSAMKQMQDVSQKMMQGMMGGGAPAGEAQKSEAAAATAIPPGSKFAKYEKLVKRKQKDNANVVFVGGLRKTTEEDRVCAHFAKFGQVEHVDIKRQPDGTSRGFALIKFADVD